MRRQAVHFADDILVEEITKMAHAHGMHVRIRDGMVTVDRVPHFVRRLDDANVVPMPERARKAKR